MSQTRPSSATGTPVARPTGPRADVRYGGAWTPLQRSKNDALWAIASLALAAVRPFPLSLLRRLGRALGGIAHAFAARARETAAANVARVFPHLAEADRRALVRRSFATLGESLGETVALLHPSRDLRPLPLAGDARTLLADAAAAGRGVLFASAHLGPWEWVAASLVAAGVPLVTLARESYDPRFSRLYERLRGRRGVRVIWRASPGAAARILRALRRGEVLGVPMDLRSRVASCEAPFLGHDAPTAVGPARLALRTGAAVVVGTAAPAQGEPSQAPWTITATRIETADLPCDLVGVRTLTARINAELSRRILALPHAWVWMHDRWTPQD
jgi:KDO2-lipid IV(A) lauroyltransferase